ncbi:AAA family ATPase [Marinifilum sp. D737]|uniref:AAA family ATPase n=1 Tax=Marinifilum sp. D737 TaxID=2969628 RepID=UPI0022765DC5|nr:AAA family ATPase [Marinifilum sp. D737]MCY1636393.1 AAA family ATPase [Marinifilum sp. D737]
MIELLSLKNVATYNEHGIELPYLKKVNFLYGANGSGKTTLSNYLKNPEEGCFESCDLKWYNNQPMKTLVYNKKFREENFGNGEIDGVFTLGKANKDEIEIIKAKQILLDDIKKQGLNCHKTLTTQKEDLDRLEDSFKEHIWKAFYKRYSTKFEAAFVGFKYKEKFKEKLKLEFLNNKSELLSLNELEQKSKIIFQKEPETKTPFELFDFNPLIELESLSIWNDKIIGKTDIDIAKLIQELNNPDWVNQGIQYINENDICPFCQQPTITKEFKEKLEKYFDESYKLSISKLFEAQNKFNLFTEKVLDKLESTLEKEKQKKEPDLDIENFSNLVKAIESHIIANREVITQKLKEPSRSLSLVTSEDIIEQINNQINSTNERIATHNDLVKNYKAEKLLLINSFWRFLIEEAKLVIHDYITNESKIRKAINGLDKQIKNKRDEYSKLKKEVTELNKNVTSIQPTIDEINRILNQYGFLNFSIQPSKTSKNHYQIQREDGSIAESTLSEGEVTFITFLYFLQLAKGATNETEISENRILVVDDPISSLDSTVLFVVSSLLKDIIKDIKSNNSNIKQIFVLTHNVYFHKEVSFTDSRKQEQGDTEFWILRKNENTTSINSYGNKNPISSSYELLWNEVKDWRQNSGISLQNSMRRIIENYFKLLGRYKDNDLIQKFETVEEQSICRSLLCWINDGSHSMPDDLFLEHPEDTSQKYLNVFRRIFEETNHIEHYKMMMGEELKEEFAYS